MRRLTQFVLASGCLLAILPSAVLAAPQNIAVAGNVPIDLFGEAEGVIFNATATLTVPDGKNIGQTGGVSATNGGPLFVPTILFQGTSIVTGDISANPLPASAPGSRISVLELQGGPTTTVTLGGTTVLNQATGQVNFKTAGSALQVNGNLLLGAGSIDFANFGTNSSVTFADGVNFSGSVDTNVIGTGSVIFEGGSTVTDGLLGKNNALLSVELGPKTVFLNQAGINKAVNFNFTGKNIDGTNTLQLAHQADITGNIDNTSGVDGQGTLLFKQDSIITGNVGSTNPLSLIRMSDVLSTVNFSENVNANTIQLSNTTGVNENTLKLSSGATSDVVSNIITAADGVGIVQLDKVANFTGNIGSETLRLNKVEVGANNNTTITGNIYVNGGVLFQDAKTLTIADGNFINGSVLGTGTSKGDLVFAGSSQSYGVLGNLANPLNSVSFNGGTFNLNSTAFDVYATNVTVRNNATLVLNQDTKFSGDLNLDVTGANLQIGNNTVTVGNDFKFDKNSTVTIDLASGVKYGNFAVANKAYIGDAGAPLALNFTTSGFIPNNSKLTILNATTAVVKTTMPTFTPSTLLSNFILTNDANNLYVTVTRNTNTSIADYPSTLGVAGALDVIQNDPVLILNPDIFAVINQLDNFTDRASFNEAIATLAPSVDGDGAEGMMAMTRLGVETIRERLDSYRLGMLDYHHIGYSAGSYDSLKDYGVWVKLLASRLKQSEYKGIEGYKSDIFGIAGGIDYTSPDEVMVYGLGLNYLQTDSLSRAQAASSKSIDSYSLMLYGTYNFNNPWYLDGIIYLTNHDYEENRNILAGPAGRSAKAEYKAWQISARAETGFVYQYNKILFQPALGLFYSHLNTDKYTEQNAGGLNLVNRPRDYNSLRLSVGPKISTVLGGEGASIVPEFHAYYNFELTNSKEQYQSNFAIGGPVFETSGIEPQRSSYVTGVGLAAYGFENLSCHVALDYEWNQTKFSAFHGWLKFKYTW